MSRPCNTTFNDATISKPRKEIAQPLSFRVTPSERATIKRLAGKRPISTYLRHAALNGKALPRRKAHAPDVNDVLVAQILAKLGQSRLASNLNQLAKAANMGALPLDEHLVSDLQQASRDVQAMRRDLIKALGVKAEDSI